MFLLVTGMFAASLASQASAQLASRDESRLRSLEVALTAQWNRTYGYMKRLDARDTSRGGGFGYASTLLESQRAWLGFRDKQCAIEAGEFAGGTLQGVAQQRCFIRITTDRTAQLKRLVWKR